MRVKFDATQLARVQDQLAGLPKRVREAQQFAINGAVKDEVSFVAKRITTKVKITQRDVKKHIASVRATASNLVGMVAIQESRRIPLSKFGARQTRAGVTYQIDRSGGRKLIAGAFGPKIAKLGQHAFKRIGKDRLPITELLGPSPWGVLVVNKLDVDFEAHASQRLAYHLDRRVELILLRIAGKVKDAPGPVGVATP